MEPGHIGGLGFRVQRCGDLNGLGTLDGEQGCLVAFVRQHGFRIGAGLILEPGPVFVLAAGVEDDHELVFAFTIDNDVVDDAARAVEQQRVLRLAGDEFGNVVGRHKLEEVERAGAGDADLAHVGHVEQPGALTHSGDLADGAAIGNRHVPAGERDHGRACGDVGAVE